MLTDSLCISAKCQEDKTFKPFPDSGGIYLEVTKFGGKYWRLKYHRHYAGTDGEAMLVILSTTRACMQQSLLATGDGFSRWNSMPPLLRTFLMIPSYTL